MNQFTKDELRIMLFWGIDRVENIGIQEFKDEGHDGLYLKLQKMIERECEHEDDGNCYYSSPPQCKCRKCGEFYR